MSARWTSVGFDGLPGFGRFFVDEAGNRLPAALRTLAGPDNPAALEERATARPPRPLAGDLAAALEIEHRRLGASAASLAAVRALSTGTAYAVITGQQPGLLGGPVFTYLKVATAVALARRLTDLHGMNAVPVLWNGADDADFDEVAGAQVPSSDLSLTRLTLPSAEHRPRTWVGDISGDVTAAVMESLDPILGPAGLPGFGAWCGWRNQARAIARDFGDWTTAHYLRWFGGNGLVVVDARLPEIRRAAQPLFRDYLEQAGAVRQAILEQAEAMEREGYPPPISAEAAAAALFLTPDRERLRLPPEETLAEARRLVETHPVQLSPNVVLRPIVADTIFPSLVHVVGPSENVYFSQLAPAFDTLGLARPVIADRLSVTLLTAECLEVARDLHMRLRDILADPADVLKRWYERQTPPDLEQALDEGRRSVEQAYGAIRSTSRTLDASLPQMVDSALEKTLFQIDRLRDGVLRKLKHRRELAAPRFRHLPEFVAPRHRPQERELSAVSLEFLFGDALAAEIGGAAREHVEKLSAGIRSHYIGTI